MCTENNHNPSYKMEDLIGYRTQARVPRYQIIFMSLTDFATSHPLLQVRKICSAIR